MVKVITYGTYDMLHYGHIRLLERAKALGDYLIVGVTSDDYDRSRGKINNSQSLMERIAAVEATGIADEIIVEEYEGQKIDDVKRLGVDIFTVGSDWTGKFDYLNDYCKVVYLDRTQGVSSSDIRAEARKIRIAIVGSGSIVEKFKYECSFVNGVELADERTCDAVYIVTNPIKHYSIIRSFLEQDKDIICESPITQSLSEYDELQKIAKERNLIIMDGVKTAYSTAYQRLLLLIKSGKIGDVISVDSTCTSMRDLENGISIEGKWNSISAWGPIALLPIFQILGTNYKHLQIVSHFIDEKERFDGFTKIDFVFDRAVASIKVAKAAKAEGELIISGTKGYVYVPAPWWKTDYFEVRYENIEDNKRYFYQLDGEGIRNEIVAFAKSIETKKDFSCISDDISRAIVQIVEKVKLNDVIKI